jgi:hypothetical protein
MFHTSPIVQKSTFMMIGSSGSLAAILRRIRVCLAPIPKGNPAISGLHARNCILSQDVEYLTSITLRTHDALS